MNFMQQNMSPSSITAQSFLQTWLQTRSPANCSRVSSYRVLTRILAHRQTIACKTQLADPGLDGPFDAIATTNEIILSCMFRGETGREPQWDRISCFSCSALFNNQYLNFFDSVSGVFCGPMIGWACRMQKRSGVMIRIAYTRLKFALFTNTDYRSA
jgi:hypothetical protein